MPDKNVLYLAEPENGAPLLDEKLAELRKVLLKVRRHRKQPMLDTKILTSWNALMIRGLAHAGAILKEDRYTSAAQKAANFLLANHRDSEGGLLRVSTTGLAKHRAFLDDYAFLIQALLALSMQDEANQLAKIMHQRFSAGPEGGFFYTDDRATDLIVRQMVGTDSPLPSGNGIAAIALLELNQPQEAQQTISAFAGQLENVSEGMSALLQSALQYVKQQGDFQTTPATDADHIASPAELAADVLKVELTWQTPTQLRLTCQIADGYHINAHDAATNPTQLRAAGPEIESVQYPPGELQEKFEITATLKSPPTKPFNITLTYQACDASACLPPVTRRFAVNAN
jgi:uncharacterized protein YyaL (SSP411 family)